MSKSPNNSSDDFHQMKVMTFLIFAAIFLVWVIYKTA